jgi:hypothetical protein
MGEPSPLTTLEKISGRSFMAVLAAVPLLQRRRPELADGRIDVLQSGRIEVVLFSPPPTAAGVPPAAASAQLQRELTDEEIRQLLSKPDRSTLVGTMRARNYAPMQRAVAVFQQKGLDLAGYELELLSEGPSLTVLFADEKRDPGMLGSQGLPGFEVVFNAADLALVRSNFVR